MTNTTTETTVTVITVSETEKDRLLKLADSLGKLSPTDIAYLTGRAEEMAAKADAE